MTEMKTLTIDDKTYEITDAKSRKDIESIQKEKIGLPINEDGNLEHGEENEVLVSNGDGTYQFKKQTIGLAAVEFDNQNRYLHFLDDKGNDVYEPVYIEGGGSGSSDTGVSVRLINNSDFTNASIVNGDQNELVLAYDFRSMDNGRSGAGFLYQIRRRHSALSVCRVRMP